MSGRRARAHLAAVQERAAICIDAAEQIDALAAIGVNELRCDRE